MLPRLHKRQKERSCCTYFVNQCSSTKPVVVTFWRLFRRLKEMLQSEWWKARRCPDDCEHEGRSFVLELEVDVIVQDGEEVPQAGHDALGWRTCEGG
jgi:hypothetical protein